MKHIAPLPSLETLRKYLTYNPETGALTWNAGLKYAKQRPAGMPAGTISKGGYLRVSIERRMYANNRVAWKMHHGIDPVGVVDHEDGNVLNNRANNLRDTSHGKNVCNRIISKSSTTGFKGVVLDTRNGRYRINLAINGVRQNCPSFATPEAANDYAVELRDRLHGEFACHGYRTAA